MRRTYVDEVFEYYDTKENDVCCPVVGDFLPRLLVVDDESSIRNLYRRVFSPRGFDVLTASNAVEAREILIRERIDIIFLDINMAEIEGDILYEIIRAFHPELKVVVASVYPLEEQKERIMNADAYFDKSDSQDVLLQIVSNLM